VYASTHMAEALLPSIEKLPTQADPPGQTVCEQLG
jgi:hypothetical protein